MSSVPKYPPIDRSRPPYRDDPVIAALTDEQVAALVAVLARLVTSYARRYDAAGGTVADIMAGMRLADVRARAAEAQR